MSPQPTCPNCDSELSTDFGHEADHYEVTCPECQHPVVVFRLVSIAYFATTDIRRIAPTADKMALAELLFSPE